MNHLSKNLNMDFNKLTALDSEIFLCYTMGYSYAETQDHIKNKLDIDLNGRKLGYRLDTLKKKFECETQLQLGYKYCLACVKLQQQQLEYQAKQDRKKYLRMGFAIAGVSWSIALLMIWYFTMWS